ncbi:hypothetical protein LR48_Vigan01g102900 [Vigna angularis]|uniref:Uncharacterized protein n=1 Tax=Phaseolus angularis TaxID=3914 RepID=A0A0L9TMV8_PHAAN|nr:hypothetical protein LR48_Vigan01g102900 [Vigna angularis]
MDRADTAESHEPKQAALAGGTKMDDRCSTFQTGRTSSNLDARSVLQTGRTSSNPDARSMLQAGRTSSNPDARSLLQAGGPGGRANLGRTCKLWRSSGFELAGAVYVGVLPYGVRHSLRAKIAEENLNSTIAMQRAVRQSGLDHCLAEGQDTNDRK